MWVDRAAGGSDTSCRRLDSPPSPSVRWSCSPQLRGTPGDRLRRHVTKLRCSQAVPAYPPRIGSTTTARQRPACTWRRARNNGRWRRSTAPTDKDRDWDHAPTPLLVVEVISGSTRRRDLVQKRELYLDAGAPEYCIVDPKAVSVRVVRAGQRDEVITDRLTWPSRKPDSWSQVVPVISPLPFSVNHAPMTASGFDLPPGERGSGAAWRGRG
jgi:hypothetical protein